MTKALPKLAAALATIAVVTGCGGDPAAPPTPPPASAGAAGNHAAGHDDDADAGAVKGKGGSRRNADDVMFLQMMVNHHVQGSQLAGLAADRGGDQQLTLLAGAIRATQKDEAAQMREWLKDWDEKTSADADPTVHAAHGGLPSTGPKQVEALRSMKKGTTFDTSFLNLMIGHQGSAVEMAEQELDKGVNPEVKELAERIKKSRSGQIELMLGMLNG